MKTLAKLLIVVVAVLMTVMTTGCSKREEVVFQEQDSVSTDLVTDRVLFVDYDQCFHDKLSCGIFHSRESCGWCDSSSIADYFPSKRTRRTELADTFSNHVTLSAKIIHFGRPMETYQVLYEMDEMGFRPAELTELLELRCDIMEEQRPQFRVVALGSTWWDPHDDCYVPQMDSREPDETVVSMRRMIGAPWHESYRFLAITK